MSRFLEIMIGIFVFLGLFYLSGYILAFLLAMIAFAIYAPGFFVFTVAMFSLALWASIKITKYIIKRYDEV